MLRYKSTAILTILITLFFALPPIAFEAEAAESQSGPSAQTTVGLSELASGEAADADATLTAQTGCEELLAEKDSTIQLLTWGLVGLTVLYIFVYIMGRRRLMLKIWKRQAELQLAREKAEEADRMKTAFIRSMSHEIRTPLNAISGFSQIICTPDLELDKEEMQNLQTRIMSNVEAVTLIINELLELAAGESVTLDVSKLTAVNPNELGRKTIEEANKRNDKQLSITFTTEIADDFTFRCNEETVLSILEKVVDNALKFTNEGSITLEAKLGDRRVVFVVSDTGIGIPEEMQDAVFDNFVKLNDYIEGVGLGLPVCRRLAHSLGGDLQLDKRYQGGSRFVLTLPLRK